MRSEGKENMGQLRTNKEMWDDIQRLIGINPNNYKESIRWISITKPELLKLEKAIKKTLGGK